MASMTINDCLHTFSQQLATSGILTARLDCLVLLEDILGRNRAQLLAHDDEIVSPKDIEKLEALITRRCTHEPLAYIRGHAMFYGRDFVVTPDVLVPRPETETIIDMLKKYVPQSNKLDIADIGSGSGCIGITAALELPQASVDLYDVSDTALAVSRQNVSRLKASAQVLKSNLLQDLAHPYEILLANLPYVPTNYPINQAATFEPKLALFSGIDGLHDYQTFWQQIAELPQKPLHVITEALPNQHHFLATMARQAGFALDDQQDFIQFFTKI